MGLKKYLPSKNEFFQKIMILKQQIFFKTHALICKALRYIIIKKKIFFCAPKFGFVVKKQKILKFKLIFY